MIRQVPRHLDLPFLWDLVPRDIHRKHQPREQKAWPTVVARPVPIVELKPLVKIETVARSAGEVVGLGNGEGGSVLWGKLVFEEMDME